MQMKKKCFGTYEIIIYSEILMLLVNAMNPWLLNTVMQVQ